MSWPSGVGISYCGILCAKYFFQVGRDVRAKGGNLDQETGRHDDGSMLKEVESIEHTIGSGKPRYRHPVVM
jgi:hypothetical protein